MVLVLQILKIRLYHAIKKLLNIPLWEQGIRTKPQSSHGANRYEFKAAHGLRKWFKTRTEQAGMKPINVELLMGHSLGLSDHYYEPTEYELMDDYLKAVDSLTINNAKQMVIKEVLENQQILATEIQAKAQRIQSLEDDIKSMREDMKNIFEVLRCRQTE
jgi:hypothetical protein